MCHVRISHEFLSVLYVNFILITKISTLLNRTNCHFRKILRVWLISLISGNRIFINVTAQGLRSNITHTSLQVRSHPDTSCSKSRCGEVMSTTACKFISLLRSRRT